MNPQLRHARRQLLTDRWTELLTEWGCDHATDRARALLQPMDDLGFRLPAALDDPPPPPSRPHIQHVRAELAAARAVIEAKRAQRETPAP